MAWPTWLLLIRATRAAQLLLICSAPAVNHRLPVCPWHVLQEAAGHAHHSRKEVLDASQLFTGLLEMGGASMQLTFLPHAAEQLPEKHGGQLHLPGKMMSQYAKAELYNLARSWWRTCCSAASEHVVGSVDTL